MTRIEVEGEHCWVWNWIMGIPRMSRKTGFGPQCAVHLLLLLASLASFMFYDVFPLNQEP